MWILLATTICLIISLRFAKCTAVTEPEYMAISIGHLDIGVYPYALHDEDIADCIKRETFEKYNKNNNNSSWTFWNTLRCLIDFSSETKEGMNSITKYQHIKDTPSSTEEILNKYCNRWTPKVDRCFEATTSLLNDCNEKEPDKGYRSLFFAAAYMSYICQNKTKTLENLFRASESTDKMSLDCFLELKNDIITCAKTKAAINRTTDFCSNYQITKSCYIENYQAASQETCRSTNGTEWQSYVYSLLDHINSELCKKSDTMNKKMMEHTAAKQTDREGREYERHGSSKKSKNNASSISNAFETLILTVLIVSYWNLNKSNKMQY